MGENKKVPPKVPPQRVQRKVEPSSTFPQYRQQPPPPPTAPNSTNNLALISLITGILSALTALIALCAWCLGGIPLILGIVAAVTGYLGKKQIDDSGGLPSSRKTATTGMVLGLVSIVLSIVFIGLGLICSGFAALSELF
jgi:hypothetical protein